MILSFAACGEKDTPGMAQSSSGEESNNEETSETEFITMAFGSITMSVPNVFSAVTEQNGMYVSAGPEASIVVTAATGVGMQPSGWNEDLVAEVLDVLYSSAYTDMELAAFEGDVNMNGNKAVYYAFYGKGEDGKKRLVHVVTLYNADVTAQYGIALTHNAEDELFTSEVNSKIINSITLAGNESYPVTGSEG